MRVSTTAMVAGSCVMLALVLGRPLVHTVRAVSAAAPTASSEPVEGTVPLEMPVAEKVAEKTTEKIVEKVVEIAPVPAAAPAPVRPAPAPVAAVIEAPAPEIVALAVPPAAPVPAKNFAPRITATKPAARETVRVIEGRNIDLSVQVKDRNSDDRLAYVWSLNGKRVSRAQRWRFAAPLGTAGKTHTVEVRVTDRAGLMAPPVSWTINVLPKMSAVNVRDWLDRLALALERKDIETLKLFGVVTNDAEATAVRKRVPWFGGYHVSIVNEMIRTDGSRATVEFDRVERDGGGRLIASARQSFQLEKSASGFIGVRGR